MSQFGDLFGTECDTYLVDDSETVTYKMQDASVPLFTQILLQDRIYYESTWTV